MMWFTKRRRAQNPDDYETWIEGGVCPTLNAFDNTGDSRATVVIAFDNSYRDGIRIQHGVTTNTLSAKMGTGGNNVPFVAYSIREDAQANNFSATEIQTARALQALWPSVQSHHAQTFIAGEMQVRRLTPVECERLMGWPDNHTLHRADGKTNSDTTRYKMCGNGVASPVAQWIAEQINQHEQSH
jgi:DNA (cytosine-5)-methyltransferase 1